MCYKKSILIILVLLYIGFFNSLHAQNPHRSLVLETIIDAPVPAVWEAFTTRKGLETFFAPECHIDLRIDGKLDILFSPDSPIGQKGVEGMRILAIQKNKIFGFTWNNPSDFPEIRHQRTHVTVKFFKIPSNPRKTRLILVQDGWGDGEIWDQAYQYFTTSWRDMILYRLHYRFSEGPVNWERPPVKKERFNIIVH